MNFFITPGTFARRKSRPSRRRAHRFSPASLGTTLERRELMAAGQLGINLATTLGFVDLMKETRAWSPLTSSTLATDANGWPLADAQVVVLDDRVNQNFNGPDANAVAPNIGGTYSLSFTGQASLSPDFANNFTVQNQVYNIATNTTTASLVVPQNAFPMLLIDFRNTVNSASSTGAGVSNVKLIQPGYAANTTQLFTNAMIGDLAPFSTVRYLNIDQANSYPATLDSSGNLVPLQWSQRKLPTAASQTSGPGAAGESWEYMIALANATNTNMWINVPDSASDSYVTQLASLIKNGDTVNGVYYAGLNPNLKVYVEYSNEVWGGTSSTTNYNNVAAQQAVNQGDTALTNDGTTTPAVYEQRYYLQRTMQITNDFRSVYGADPTFSAIRPVLGWQENDPSYYSSTFQWFEKTYGAPDQYFYGMGDAIYNLPTDYSTVDHLFASLNATLPGESASDQQFVAVANYYGLQTVSYEGGPDTGANVANSAQGQVALAASRDPRMEAFIVAEYDAWYAAGGGLANLYDGPYDEFTPYNQFALAELNQASNPTASPKYQGAVDLSTATPVAVTGGAPIAATTSTSLSVTSDSLGQAFPSSSLNDWLLNVATAGTYTLSIQTAGTTSGQVTVSTSDTTKVGTYTLSPSGSNVLTTVVLHAGLNSLAIASSNNFVASGVTLTPASMLILGDPGFESDSITNAASTNFVYDPTGSAWTYSGYSGVSGNGSAFTSQNPNAPQGTQVGFLQATGSITEPFNATTTGSYHFSFQAAQRSYPVEVPQTVQVLIDGVVVGNLTPSATSYQSLSTSSFLLTAGSHTLSLRGTVASGNATAFIDSIGINQDSASTTTSTNSLSDGGFEAETISGSAPADYTYDPTGSVWTYAGNSGVSGNGSAFTYMNPNAPQGTQVAFLQSTGSINQAVTITTAGSYSISLSAAQRTYSSGGAQSVQVLVDGVLAGTLKPSNTSYQTLLTSSFALTAGLHTIKLQGTASADATAFIDNVALIQDTTALAASMSDGGFESETISGSAPADYTYDPTGSVWTYAGESGVSGNGSAFTYMNPNAPQGSQVAFLQSAGSISQAIFVATAGNYSISLSAAQRDYSSGGAQSVQVLVDGVLVGTLTPSSINYQSLATGSFALTAGSHTITLQGTASGDATAFVDNLAITQSTTSPAPTSTGGLADSGFESETIAGTAPMNYIYDPTGSVWTYAGNSGVSGNGSNFTYMNPNAPQGTQVAFLQGTGSISQAVTITAAGNYVLNLLAAQRVYSSAEVAQSVQVLVDGVLVGTLSPSGSSYQSLSTGSFALTAGTHTITLQGAVASPFATAFVDSVDLTQAQAAQVSDGSFEAEKIPNSGPGNLVYNPTSSVWTFSSNSGVSGNGSYFTSGNPVAPQGTQVAFLQNQGSISQTISGFVADNYTISLSAAQRANYSTQSFQVLVDGVVVATFTPTSTNYLTYTTASFALSAGSHTIVFQGLNKTGDTTAFLDNITLNAQ